MPSMPQPHITYNKIIKSWGRGGGDYHNIVERILDLESGILGSTSNHTVNQLCDIDQLMSSPRDSDSSCEKWSMGVG